MSLIKVKNYYEKPEGQDFFGKMLATNTYAAAAGLAWSSFDVLMASYPKGYIATIGRIAYNVGPMVGMATAFTVATYAATNLRGKDDRINYFLGGVAAGGVYGAWRRSHMAGMFMGFVFGVAGILKKTSIIEGWEFFPDVNYRGYSGVTLKDYSLMAERPKNWTTGKNDS